VRATMSSRIVIGCNLWSREPRRRDAAGPAGETPAFRPEPRASRLGARASRPPWPAAPGTRASRQQPRPAPVLRASRPQPRATSVQRAFRPQRHVAAVQRASRRQSRAAPGTLASSPAGSAASRRRTGSVDTVDLRPSTSGRDARVPRGYSFVTATSSCNFAIAAPFAIASRAIATPSRIVSTAPET
jgi:hypothetical protein